MAHRLEAIFEGGILRPLEPLQLPEHQRVTLTINYPIPVESVSKDDNRRLAEQEWVGVHGKDYIGQWVALDGGSLIAHGSDAVPVRDQALAKGVVRPFVVRIPHDFGQPSAGWL